MSNYYWIIDAGHGGIKEGKYVTAPAKMHKFDDGFTIHEGEVNRKISALLQRMLQTEGIDFCLVYDEVEDTSLDSRINLVNKVYEKNPNAILLSIHSNAGGGKGLEIFTSIGQNKSDVVAEYLHQSYTKYLPKFKFREDESDGDHDKEARFAMVGYERMKNGKVVWYGPKCPAVLVENLFFDNREEAEYLNSEIGQHEIAKAMFEGIAQVELNKPI